jgi:hypothetical protein
MVRNLCDASQKTNDADIKAKLTNLVRVAVERAESLKGILDATEDESVIESLAKLPSVPEGSFPNTEQSLEEEQPVNQASTVPGFTYNIVEEEETVKL